MKNRKHRGLLFLFLITLMLCYGKSDINVYAADKNWPGVNYDNIPDQYSNMQYCVYNTGNVLRTENDSISNRYSNSSYILLNDSSTKSLKFLYPDGSLKTAIPNSVESFEWYDAGVFDVAQYIYLGSDLYDYLVDDTGSLSCKELYFVEQPGKFALSFSGSLGIYTPNRITTDFPTINKDGVSKRLETIKEYGITGTIGNDYSTVCNEKLNQLQNIMNSYNVDSDLELLNILSSTGITQENLTDIEKKGQEYISNLNEKFKQNDDALMDLKNEIEQEQFDINLCNNDLKKTMDEFVQKKAEDGKLFSQYSLNFENHMVEASKRITFSEEQEQLLTELQEKNKEINEWINDYLNRMNNFKIDVDMNLGGEVNVNCDGIIGKDLIDYLDKIFGWIRIAVPIIVIVLGSLDFGQAVLQDDKDALQKAIKKFTTRCIIAVIIFFIPTILIYILNVFNDLSVSNISACGIGGVK